MNSFIGEASVSGNKRNPPPLSSLRNPTFEFLDTNYKKSELQRFCDQLQIKGIWTTKAKIIEKIIAHLSTANKPPPSALNSTTDDSQGKENEGVLVDLLERFEIFMRETNDNFYVVNNSLAEKEREINELKTKLFLAEETIRNLQDVLSNKGKTATDDVIPAEKKILLIGDSCLQEVRNNDLQDNVIVRTLPDSNISMLKSWIEEKLTHPLKECVIYCGVQDLLDKENTPEESIKGLDSLLADFRANSEDVKLKICELVPSLKSVELNVKINQFNAKVEEWCDSNGIVFVKTNGYFKLGTGEIDLLCYNNTMDSEYDKLSRVGATRLLDAISAKSEYNFLCNNWRTIKQNSFEGNNFRKALTNNTNRAGFNVADANVGYRTRFIHQNMNNFSNQGNDKRRGNARLLSTWSDHGNVRGGAMRGQANSRFHYANYKSTTNRNRIGCYNCGEFNHVQSNCRYDHKIKCNVCHEYGHKSKLCVNHRY